MEDAVPFNVLLHKMVPVHELLSDEETEKVLVVVHNEKRKALWKFQSSVPGLIAPVPGPEVFRIRIRGVPGLHAGALRALRRNADEGKPETKFAPFPLLAK